MSFMTVPECRESKNPNHVRCFDKGSLMPEVLDEKWDLIKVTCQQSFNKNVQFGLSFIKIYAPDAISTASSASPLASVAKSPKEKKSCDETFDLSKNSVFAQFKMRSDSSDSDKESDQSSSLFSKWKKTKDSPQKSSSNGQSLSCKLFIQKANQNSLFYCFTDIFFGSFHFSCSSDKRCFIIDDEIGRKYKNQS